MNCLLRTQFSFAVACLLVFIASSSTPAWAQHKSAGSAFERGCSQMMHKNFAAAISSFDEAISDNSSDVNAYFRRGQSFFCLGKYNEAVVDFDRAASKGAMDPNLYLWCGTAYSKMGKTELAVFNYERAMRLNPKLAENYLAATKATNHSSSKGQVGSSAEDGVKQNVSQQPQDAASTADVVKSSGSPIDSGSLSEKVHTAANLKTSAASAIEGVTSTLDREGGTHTTIDQAKTKAPSTEQTSQTLSVGSSQPSVDAYVTAVKNVTENETGYFRPGIVYSGILNQSGNPVPLGDIGVDETNKETIDSHQQSKSGGGGDKTDELKKSLRALDTDINAQPQSAKLFFRRALVQQELKHSPECLADLTRAIDLDKTNPHLFLARAFYYLQQGKINDADADIRMAQEINPIVPAELTFQPQNKQDQNSKL